MTPRSTGTLAVLAGVAAAIVVAVTIQAGGPAMNDPDSAASVLYFRHIVDGERLEAFVATTPKPLLTLVYGLAWTVTGDWRTLGWVTIAVFGVAIACGTELLRRLAGPAAAVFVAIALALSPVMALEISRANSFVWAVAGWFATALALALPRPRVWVAAGALLLAFLSRTETIVFVLPATAWIIWLVVRGRTAEARALAPLLGAWLALPIASIHDLLLTGNPLYWVSVPAGYTALVAPDLRPIAPLALVGEVVARYAGMPAMVALAAIGGVRLVLSRRWAALAALAGLTAGVTALLVAIAWRHVYVTTRYLEQVDVGVLIAAAVGVGWIAEVSASWLAARVGSRGPSPAIAAAAVIAVIAAVIVSLPPAQRDGGLAAELDRVRTASRNADLVRPRLAELLAAAAIDEPPRPVSGPAGLLVVDTSRATILVPRSLINRLLVDLDKPLTTLGDSWLALRDGTALDGLAPGQSIYHDRAGDLRPELFGPLEVDAPVEGPSVRLTPSFVDPTAGIWILDASAR